jgi:hypothetical protein
VRILPKVVIPIKKGRKAFTFQTLFHENRQGSSNCKDF